MIDGNVSKKPTPYSVGVYHYYHTDFYSSEDVRKTRKMHGVKRVLVFCILIVILPCTLIIMPLYLRRSVFADVIYPVAESDIIEIRDGISSIFCQQHSLSMNSNFNAFQLGSKPEISTSRKHIRLKKSMTLPDDTLEYWGFYLLKGAKVHLKFCSRYDGSRILVVKGQRQLRTCGLLDHNKNKLGANYAQGHEQVKVFFEDITEIAGNVPADELERKLNDSGIKKNNFMEMENHGGEDLSDDSGTAEIHSPGQILTNLTATPKPMRQRGKKLKKGTLNSQRQRKPDNATSSAASSAAISEENVTVTGEAVPAQKTIVPSVDASGLDINSSRTNESREAVDDDPDRANDDSFRQRHQQENEHRKQLVYDQLYKRRERRELVYDRKYSHGGNAVNFTETDESNSISSFETGLFDCFNGDILLAEGFPPQAECLNTHFLENGSHRMLSKHEITEDGYYYYIFYSDNDLVRNDIHAIFDIYKPTFQYSNLSDSHGCVNATNCTFPIRFLSDEIVVVEVPTRDGIEHEEDDITYLISTCHPRTEIYAVFPILVLILILSCAFL